MEFVSREGQGQGTSRTRTHGFEDPGRGDVLSGDTADGGPVRLMLHLADALARFKEREAAFQQQALARQGAPALDLPGLAQRWYADASRDISGKLGDPGLRAAFREAVAPRTEDGLSMLRAHADGQAQALRGQALAQGTAQAEANAERFAASPHLVERELDDAVRHVAVFGPDDDAEREGQVRAAADRVLGRAVTARAGADPAAARALLDRWGGAFGPEALARLDSLVSGAERGARRTAAWEELAPGAGVARDALSGGSGGDAAVADGPAGPGGLLADPLADPAFLARHGLDASDAAHLASRLAVARAASARDAARAAGEGARAERERFWELAQSDPLAAHDHLENVLHMPGEQRDALSALLRDPAWDGKRIEDALAAGPDRSGSPAGQEAGQAEGPENDPEDDPGAAPASLATDSGQFTASPAAQAESQDDVPAASAPAEGGAMERDAERPSAVPGAEAAQTNAEVQADPGADPRAGDAADANEAARLENMRAGTTHAEENREYGNGIVPVAETTQQEDIKALAKQMGRLKYPDTGDLNPRVTQQREEYEQELVREFVSHMGTGKDARQVVQRELERVPSGKRPDPALVNSALTPRAGVAPSVLGNALYNDEKTIGQYARERGWKLDEFNSLWSRKLDGSITPEETTRLEQLGRDLPPEVKAKGMADWLTVMINEEYEDLADKASSNKALTATAAAAALAGMPTAAVALFGTAAARREFTTSAGEYYRELSQARDKNGNPMPDEMARIGAYVGGLMNGGFEAAQYIGLGKILGTSEKLAGKAGMEALKEALKNPENFKQIAEGAIKAGKVLRNETLQNMGESFLQEFYPNAVYLAANVRSKTDFNATPSNDDAMYAIDRGLKKTGANILKREIF
ncbi:hypothetical protein dsx2_1542 [Desulfovibrio sp. X2]|uniref:hypothetical protein n=1 Tax=Desulfovibrio sp. X2 TaxID=941449 RepID=UPI00035898C9|nr:hypothetical protein [Desulfovibrio sp. X2]EPR44583.1 hypothetical protein dsx2_1542 [Desulfovibrio sp. X2]